MTTMGHHRYVLYQQFISLYQFLGKKYNQMFSDDELPPNCIKKINKNTKLCKKNVFELCNLHPRQLLNKGGWN